MATIAKAHRYIPTVPKRLMRILLWSGTHSSLNSFGLSNEGPARNRRTEQAGHKAGFPPWRDAGTLQTLATSVAETGKLNSLNSRSGAQSSTAHTRCQRNCESLLVDVSGNARNLFPVAFLHYLALIKGRLGPQSR